MIGASWHHDPRCPALDALALLTLRHVGFDGAEHDGRLVIAASLADQVVEAFERIFRAGFPIERMQPIDAFGGDDDRSMAANNSSGFNFRTIAGSTTLSLHGAGCAIDINPVQNPFVVGEGRIYPPAGAGYLDRADLRRGMIVRPGPVTDAFDAVGWEWGGDWTSRKDYQHFAVRPADLPDYFGGPKK
jgi:hypothetical protein